jgi:hypothetical protein
MNLNIFATQAFVEMSHGYHRRTHTVDYSTRMYM